MNWRSNVNLTGNPAGNSSLYGEDTTNFFYFYDDHNCMLSNIEIQNGYAEFGGAMNLAHYSTPDFLNIRIHSCESEMDGGGIYSCDYSNPTFTNTTFICNSGRYGGAFSSHSSNASLDNVSFLFNDSYEGGGVYAAHCNNIAINQGQFENNTGTHGGACEFYRSDTVTINNSSFEKNEATTQSGGAVYLQESDVIITNCTMNGNKAFLGGGAIGFYHTVNLTLNNVSITNDTASYGGGIYGQLWSTLTLRNVELSGNYAEGGAYTDDHGGALNLWDVDTEIFNVTISDNHAEGLGGAIYNKAGNISIVNSILWSNSPDEIFEESGAVTAEYSDIEGGWTGTGNLNVYPEFYDTTLADFSLHELSPCIDMGTPDTTGLFLPEKCLAGNPRIGNGRIDMGAFEYFERMELELSVFLEGPFNGTDMNTDLNGNPELVEGLPLSQPYNIPPWNYLGSESVESIPTTDVVDWVLIELRNAADAGSATSGTMVSQQAAFLINDGSIMGLDGTSNPIFSNSITQQLFVVIRHRNHLGVLSAYPLSESGGVYSYNFTSPTGQAYGTDAQKNLDGGAYGMYSGDGNADGTINMDDKVIIWSVEAGNIGYLNGDFNMNSQTDNSDKNDIWIENNETSSQIPD